MSGSVNLGPRLRAVASFIPSGARLGDIGTDHAYLPIALYEEGKISNAVAVDVHPGPFQSALAGVKERGLENVIDVRFGDGLKPLTIGEVTVLSLAGMGGRTMLDIFSARPDIMNSVASLILQPQGAEGSVRLTLLREGWRLKAEQLVEEDERIYVVMKFTRDLGWNLSELEKREEIWCGRLRGIQEKNELHEQEFQSIVRRLVWQFGPLLLDEPNELLVSQFKEYQGRLSRQLLQMKKSKSPEIIAKLREVSNTLDLVEGLGKWQ